MRSVLRAALAGLVLTASTLGSAGLALAGPMDSLFGNTVMLTYDNGPTVKVMVDADGGFTVLAPDGSASSGTWETKGSKVCYMQTSPAPPADAKPVCLPNVSHAVGESWDGTGVNGMHFTAVITEGR